MTYKTPRRLTILHFEQRFFTDADTFMCYSSQPASWNYVSLHSRSFDYNCGYLIRPDRYENLLIIPSILVVHWQ